MPDKRGRRVPQFILDEIDAIARLLARIPTAKELAARGNCSVRQVQDHRRKAVLRAKRSGARALRYLVDAEGN